MHEQKDFNLTFEQYITMLKNEDEEIRNNAIWGLTNFGSRAFPALLEALSDKSSYVRFATIKALSTLHNLEATSSLIALFRIEPNFDLRALIIEVLAELQDPRATKVLIEALKDNHFSVRKNAAEALGKIGNKSAVKKLIEALNDTDVRVTFSAITALGKIGDKTALSSLEKIKEKHKNENDAFSQFRLMRMLATKAIEEINKKVETKD
jgi:HEAT repeat protein